MSELDRLFASTGVPQAHAARVRAHLGETAAARLREDPWLLLLVPGVLPEQADRFARALLGADPGSADARRCRALVTHLLLRAARAGHTATPVEDVVTELSALGVPDPEQAVEAALDEATVMMFEEEPPESEDFGEAGDDGGDAGEVPDPYEPARTLALARHGLAEEAVAEGVVRLMATAGPLLDDPSALDVPEEIREAAMAALRCGVSIVAGAEQDLERAVAPLSALGAHGVRVAVAAATARAAAALSVPSEVTAASLHRLLDARDAAGGVAFGRGEQSPIEADLVIVYDAAALDVELAAALVEACADGAHLVLCGDPAGLLPAGPGRVFADLAGSAAVPVTRAGPAATGGEGALIRELAAAVDRGRLPRVDAPDRQVVIVPAAGDDAAAHRTVQLVTDSIPRALGIAAADVQVVTPAWAGAAGAAVLNRMLKERLNPGHGAHEGFDVGDRVLVHGPLPQAAPGETGVVRAATEDGLEIEFPDGMATVPRPLLPRLRPGWAMTVRQARGTRWPAVVAVLPAEAGEPLSRALVSTAFGRAQRHLSVVQAAGPALAGAVRSGTAPGPGRRTRLTGLLAGMLGG
ncbi:MAG TPA: AAA family ATPase [Actinomadura sp.]|jgi:exodeoxyribonuclease V alpha subunit|nr:AAA family ATPase [Actinomadura sp.]